MHQTTAKEKIPEELLTGKAIPFKIINNGEGHLKIAKVHHTGETILLKDLKIDPLTRKAQLITYNPADSISAMWKFVNKHRHYRNQDIKSQEKRTKEESKHRKFGKGYLQLYEAVFPKEGGIKFRGADSETGYIYPELFCGAPIEDFTKAAFGYKKMIAYFSKYLDFKKPTNILKAWFLKDSIPVMIEVMHHGLKNYMLEKKGYSRSTQGLWNLWNNAEKAVKQKHKQIIKWIKEVSCYYVEYDYAYKYRGQDIFGEIRKREFKIEKKGLRLKNRFLLILCFLSPAIRRKIYSEKLYSRPVKEIFRIFDILIERDYDDMQVKWRGLRDKVCLFLEFNDYIVSVIQKAIIKTNLKKIRFTREDEYWLSFHTEYRYQNLSIEEREKRRIKRYGK